MSKNLKLKKVNKSFVPEPISCFSDSYMFIKICERFMYVNILVVFLDFNVTLFVKQNDCYSSTRMAFALDNLRRLICL